MKPSLKTCEQEVADILALFIPNSTPAERVGFFSFAIAYANKRGIAQAEFLKACNMSSLLPVHVSRAEAKS